ncbi:MAG: hypothetical protein ACRDYE_04730 [Acidimicrobiales bacterium]
MPAETHQFGRGVRTERALALLCSRLGDLPSGQAEGAPEIDPEESEVLTVEAAAAAMALLCRVRGGHGG